jgi:hypothetical protein
MEQGHWARWHERYDDPGSSLSRRLAIVQQRIRDAVSGAPAGPVRLASMCAGAGRDVIGALADHPRRADVRALLVELDPDLAATARRSATAAGLAGLEVADADASCTSAYATIVPVDVMLVCGVFGNVSDADIRATVDELPRLVAPGATVIWTRHRLDPDLTPTIREWFAGAGFEEVAFDSEEGYSFGVGTARFNGAVQPFRPEAQLFRFVGDGTGALR